MRNKIPLNVASCFLLRTGRSKLISFCLIQISVLCIFSNPLFYSFLFFKQGDWKQWGTLQRHGWVDLPSPWLTWPSHLWNLIFFLHSVLFHLFTSLVMGLPVRPASADRENNGRSSIIAEAFKTQFNNGAAIRPNGWASVFLLFEHHIRSAWFFQTVGVG